jgi:hypothetical protein
VTVVRILGRRDPSLESPEDSGRGIDQTFSCFGCSADVKVRRRTLSFSFKTEKN